MTLSDILSSEELRHHEFPVTRDKVFLGHAGDCPLPRRVAEAIAEYARESATGDQEKFVYPAILDQGRKLAAQLLKCKPDEVAFVGPTSLALSFLASGLKLRRSDNILPQASRWNVAPPQNNTKNLVGGVRLSTGNSYRSLG